MEPVDANDVMAVLRQQLSDAQFALAVMTVRAERAERRLGERPPSGATD